MLKLILCSCPLMRCELNEQEEQLFRSLARPPVPGDSVAQRLNFAGIYRNFYVLLTTTLRQPVFQQLAHDEGQNTAMVQVLHFDRGIDT